MKTFSQWCGGLIQNAVSRALADDALAKVLSERVITSEAFTERLDARIDYDQVADGIDLNRLAKQIDLSSLAYEIDDDSVAQKVADVMDVSEDLIAEKAAERIDTDEVAQKVADAIDLDAESLDYERLAKALVRQIAKNAANL